MSSASPAQRRPELLAIDVEAEIRHLCEEQLQGPWQVPSELVRLALATGATRVGVNLSRRGFAAVFEGAALAALVLEAVALVLDRRQPDEVRQRAISAVEQDGAQALLWAAGLAGAALTVSVSTGRERVRLHVPRDGRPVVSRMSSADRARRTRVEVSGARIDAGRARGWLHAACRFTPRPVVIDGSPAARGFPDGLYRMSVTRPLRAQVAITESGEAPRLWLLQHGVVAARASIPRYPAFQAAVEMGAMVAANASAADLRAAVTPFLGELVDRAVELMILVARKLPDLADTVRQRVVLLLLRAARMGLREAQIRSIPLLDVVSSGDVRGAPVSIAGLAGLAHAGTLFALAPDDDRRRFNLDAGMVLALTGEQRQLVTDLANVSLGQPPLRRSPGSVRRAAVGGVSVLGGWLTEPWSRLLRLMPRRPLDDAELSDDERRLASRLRLALGGRAEVRMCRGSGPVGRRRGGRVLLLPRDNVDVRRCVHVAAAGEVWVFPMLLALDTGREPPAEVYTRWLRAVLGGGDNHNG